MVLGASATAKDIDFAVFILLALSALLYALWILTKRGSGVPARLVRKKELCLATSRTDAVDLVVAAIGAAGGAVTESDARTWAGKGHFREDNAKLGSVSAS